MKCPFRKIIKHEEKYCNMPAKDIEEFAECYEKECPYYIEVETINLDKDGMRYVSGSQGVCLKASREVEE